MEKSKTFSFEVTGRYALFTDPIHKLGGDKYSYPLPTYEALKGIAKSIYWKPTFIWEIERVRVLNKIRTESKNMKPLKMSGGNDLAIYTYLYEVSYQVEAHYVWNKFRPEFSDDRIENKHSAIIERMIERGGRRDISLGSRECQANIEPCEFGSGEGYYDQIEELPFGIMFHGFDYPDETGINMLKSRFWSPVMKSGIVEFIAPHECTMIREIHKMVPAKLKSSGLAEEGLQDELL